MSVFRKMAQFGSPLKLLPSSAKRSKPSIDWNQCIICPIPTSLFHDDGTMRTTSKADLAQQLEQDVSIIQTLPIFDIFRTTLIRDGIPLLQSINAKRVRTFGEMALDIKKIRSLAFSWHPLSSISLIDMTFKTLSKRQNGTVDPCMFSRQKIMR